MGELTKYSGDNFEKNSKYKAAFDHASEIARKHILDNIPFYGKVINEVLDFNADLKAKRTIDFMDGLIHKMVEEYGEDFSIEDLKNESVSDLLGRVLQNIHNTTSEFKKDRFRDILLLKIRIGAEDLMFVKFVDLLDKVNEIQIVLLKEIVQNERFLYGVGAHKGTEIVKAYNETIGDNLGLKFLESYASESKKEEVEFFILELSAFGLLKGVTSKSSRSMKYIPTPIGQKFLTFIIND